MTTDNASKLEFSPATAADMPFIRETIERERLDPEHLESEQFITVRRDSKIVAFGRIKPYERTYELASVAVVESERGKGLGEAIVRELVRRFPQHDVYVTTDLPQYFERLGFLRTEILPDELSAKIERVYGTYAKASSAWSTTVTTISCRPSPTSIGPSTCCRDNSRAHR
ncbi:MAG: GNAT family N-acetyltransferase [Chloroflexota bacterium]|nr:GNAT family N-acetyltransferase [Chloroflexota bacterium]